MEIERKWLIRADRIPYDLSQLPCSELEQAYISFSPTIRIRSINAGEECYITVKTGSKEQKDQGLAREEYEIPISCADYQKLLPITRGSLIHKKRYVHKLNSGLKEEIDVFSGDLEGLAYMEIEFPDADSAREYPNPEWIEKDVTYEYAYKNSSLAENGLPEELKQK